MTGLKLNSFLKIIKKHNKNFNLINPIIQMVQFWRNFCIKTTKTAAKDN